MNFKILKLEDSGRTYAELVALMHASFEERLSQGLRFTCSSMTEEQFRSRTKDGTVLVAVDEQTGRLLATATVHLYTDGKGVKYGYNEYLAVSPEAKRAGLGTMLLKARTDIVLENGGEYLMSDTACGAASSVNWHLKNGFFKYALCSYGSTNYYSYIFKKYLVGKRKQGLSDRLRFVLSCVRTVACRRKDGNYRLWVRPMRHNAAML